MTDEDREIMDSLAKLKIACAELAGGIVEDDLTYEKHLELALQFICMAELLLKRALSPVLVANFVRPYVLPSEADDGS